MELTPDLSWLFGVLIAGAACFLFRSAPALGWGRVAEVVMGVALVVIAVLLILGVRTAEPVPGCVYDDATTGYYCWPDSGIPGPAPAPEGD